MNLVGQLLGYGTVWYSIFIFFLVLLFFLLLQNRVLTLKDYNELGDGADVLMQAVKDQQDKRNVNASSCSADAVRWLLMETPINMNKPLLVVM